MSSSADGSGGADGRDRHGRRVTKTIPQVAPGTRAERRYGVDPARVEAQQTYQSEPWPDPDSDPRTGRYGEAPRGHEYEPEGDPRTGAPSFEFRPSPLQPRQPSPQHYYPPTQPPQGARQAVPPPPAPPSGPLPQSPYDLQDPAENAEPDYGAPPPEAAPPRRVIVPEPTLHAPTRARRSVRESANAPIVPAGSVTGRSLTLVVAIMCFLACLTTGAVYLMNLSAAAWLRDIASEVTVQVEAREPAGVDRQIREVVAFLGKQPGVVAAKPLSLEASAGLLEPWLGQSEGLKNLPVPRMIAVEVDRFSPPDFNAIRNGLASAFKGVALDDHRHWQQQIRTVTRSFALGGLAILALVALATMAIIVSATRSALASNREIVEVLHFVGATDRFIARQFQKHFLWLGIRAGVFGAALAALAFFSMPFVMELLGGGSASLIELQHLVGTGALDWPGYAWLGAVVVVVAALCMLTSRVGVYRILNGQH
jgi:cell division transport system permease protein